jgi:hypothetical protein
MLKHFQKKSLFSNKQTIVNIKCQHKQVSIMNHCVQTMHGAVTYHPVPTFYEKNGAVELYARKYARWLIFAA